MNKIPAPGFDDDGAFRALAANARLGSYPNLLPLVVPVTTSYAEYRKANGNPYDVSGLALSADQSGFLKLHFRRPPKDLVHISNLRESTEHLVCPMCGSMHRGTLDHYLPQNAYPVFAVFSLNLVPACKCNSKRQDVVRGPMPGERVLHPYFDDCLTERLIAAKFEDLGAVPKVSLVLTIPSTHPDFAAIAFHVRTIVLRTAVLGYLANRWNKFYRRPSRVVRAFERNIPDPVELRRILLAERQAQDDLHDGKNNWDSLFVSGLLEPPVLTWLAQQFSRPGRALDAPLV